MTHRTILGTLTALTLACLPAVALADDVYDNGNITVSPLREQKIGLSHGTNAPIVLYTASVSVKVSDLDLRGEAGWAALGNRVSNASRLACKILDRRTRTSSKRCPGDATNAAMRSALPLRTAQVNADALVFKVGKS